ncbi:MAG: hypothetical protein ACTS8H_01550 [Arsenophonus sp. NC-PE1-MAG3]
MSSKLITFLCLLIIGDTCMDGKKLIALEDDYRESEAAPGGELLDDCEAGYTA